MSDRSIVVRLRAEVDGFRSAMAQAAKATEQVGKGSQDAAKKADTAMGQMVQSASKQSAAWTTAGTTLAGFGAAALGGLTLATKAAMDWESAWAGVTKTVDGTPQQMAALESGLRGLARELPATHTEIAAVAEAAGQLGIATPNVLSFTRTMINMGESTNLSAEEAATSMARFINITGTGQQDIGKLGAAIVGLGNNFATTESEIMAMSMRLAGAGAQANMSEGDILGIATAMSSVGIEAEAGGSAMSQTMKRIGKAVDEGGDKLDLFSQVSGMSAQQFSDAWRNDPTTALDAFITGLGGVESQGMTTNGVLAELGITGIREADSLLRLSSASESGADGMSLLADAVQTGNAEFDKGTALVAEAAKRYETAESKIKIARNALVDFGISVGGTVLPAVASFADKAGDLAGWFADLPAPVTGAIAAIAGVAGVLGTVGGATLLVVPRLLDTVNAFKTLKSDMPGVAGGVGKVGKALGIMGAAAVAFPLVVSGARALEEAIRGIDTSKLELGMNELTSNMLEAGRTGDVFSNVLGDLYDQGVVSTKSFANLGEAVKGVANLDTDWFAKTGKSLGLTNTDLKALDERLRSTGDALQLMAQTDLPTAQASFKSFYDEAKAGGATFDEIMQIMPGFRDELVGVADSMGLGHDNATLLKIATGQIAPVVDEATGAINGYTEGMGDAADATSDAAKAADDALQSILDLANGFIDSERATMDYKDALADVSKAAQENGKHWEDGTKAADDNKRALLDVADQAHETASALSAQGLGGASFLLEARQDAIDAAIQFGASKKEAEAYADQLYGTPDEIQTVVDFEDDEARQALDALYQQIWPDGGHPPMSIEVKADTDPADMSVERFKGAVTDGPPANAPVDADTTSAQQKADGFKESVEGSKATTSIDADTTLSQLALGNALSEIDASGGTITIDGQTVPADQALAAILSRTDGSEGTMTIDGNNSSALGELNGTVRIVNNADGTISILGDNSGANSATDGAVGHANSSSGEIDVNADASSANSAINNAARNRTAYINVVATGVSGVLSTIRSSIGHAHGGAIYGPGTGTSDSIPSLLSNGEHVWTAQEVAAAGGQAAMYRARERVLSGTLRFAEGGGVGLTPPIRMQAAAPAYTLPAASAARGGLSIETMNIQPQVRADDDPTTVGRRTGEWFVDTLRGVKF